MVSACGCEIEFQSKTLRSTGVPGLAVICEAPVGSVWFKEGGTGHANVGTEPVDVCCLRLADGLSCRSMGTSTEPSEIC